MTEIEIKAHVADPETTERTIRGFATFLRQTTKSDTYWKRTDAARGESTGQESAHAVISAAMAIFTFIAALGAAVCVIAGAPQTVAILICLGSCMFVAAATFLAWKRQLAESRGEKNDGSAPLAAGSRTAPERDFASLITAPVGANPVKIRIREESGVTVVTYKRKELQGDIEVNDEREFSIDDREAFESLIGDLGFEPCIRKEKETKSFLYRSPDGWNLTIELSLVRGLGWFVELEILAPSPDEEEISRARQALRAALGRCGIDEGAIEPRYYTDMLAEAAEAAGGTASKEAGK